jgi:hypothetical protein
MQGAGRQAKCGLRLLIPPLEPSLLRWLTKTHCPKPLRVLDIAPIAGRGRVAVEGRLGQAPQSAKKVQISKVDQ